MSCGNLFDVLVGCALAAGLMPSLSLAAQQQGKTSEPATTGTATTGTATTGSVTTDSSSAEPRILQQVIQLAAHGGGELLVFPAAGSESKLPARLLAWLQARREALVGAGPSPFEMEPAWGQFTTRGETLYLHVLKLPQDGKLAIPRMHNSVEAIRVLGGAEIAGTELHPEIDHWLLQVPQASATDEIPVIALRLNGPPRRSDFQTPPAVAAAAAGEFVLHARDSITHGRLLRFEPQSHKNTVGYWADEQDWVEWRADAPQKERTYAVQLRYGCGTGNGGSTVALSAGDQTLEFQVEATGGFQTWRDVTVGRVTLPADREVRVVVKPIHKAKAAVMDIQQIVLRPVDPE